MFLGPIALALALAGCGGKESFTVSGTVTGLKFSGMELTNGSDKITVQPPADSTMAVNFSFPNSIDYGDEYEIGIKNPAHQSCGPAISGALKGSAGYTQTINVAIVCSINAYQLTGTVAGLDMGDLTVINGNGSEFKIAKGSTSFKYPDAIKSQTSYGLVVLTQPSGGKCSIANGTGTMGDADVTNIAITCAKAP
ncbi:hypothetical protein C9I28_03700 [Pseudoduganella armeniaca]|uniref:Uncharacterized protein n=2 Tax=Pseudoduganella armeniaca TaxID=2072590 RepID=A0A2R4C5V7_9BURK|nr:hypothetical protein C9I28_03700 [Pseudoduganella armeniaca]